MCALRVSNVEDSLRSVDLAKTFQNLNVSSPAPVTIYGEKEKKRFIFFLVEKKIIAGTAYGLAVWAHGQVEDAEGMAREGGKLLHGRIFPDDDLVLGEAVRAHKLVCRFRPSKIAHL